MRDNGLSRRIAETIEELQGQNNVPQSVVNVLILEVAVHNSEQIGDIAESITEHGEEHHDIELAHTQRQNQRNTERKELDARLKKVERILYFPSKYPGRSFSILMASLIVLSAWFLSGTRLLILQAVNAPDWLISFLNPGAILP